MKKTARGFTLVELLIVIAIIVILAAVGYIFLNPPEIMKQGRDSGRLGDLANLQQAIYMAAQESTASGTDLLCVGGLGSGTTCTGASNSTDTNNRKTDGTGWVKVDFTPLKTVSMPTLPVDSINDAAYHYEYASDGKSGWEINAVLESDKYKDKMEDDGGNDPARFELGSDLELIVP